MMATATSYDEFLQRKRHSANGDGFEPTFFPPQSFDFQRHLIEWSVRMGRSAIFAECGMGKTLMELAWAQNVVQNQNRHVLVLAPLAVTSQTVREADKFGLEAIRSRDGTLPASASVVVTNYEKLHLFKPTDFCGMVCDEASILKSFDGVTRSAIIEFFRKLRFRLLATATPAPNDTTELGNASEALGAMGHQDMLSRYFTNEAQSLSPISLASKWRLKAHAVKPFWQWVSSWARAVRKPSDLGFDDGPMKLPPLTNEVHVVHCSVPRPGELFVLPARDLREQRADRRATVAARCAKVAELADNDQPFLAWCHLNAEGDTLEKLIRGCVQVSGSDSDDEKEEKFEAFTSGQARVLVTKSMVAGMGMNWQHCNAMSFFPSHSYEQMYQSVRRCWRFGQTRPVTAHFVTSDGEPSVMQSLQAKAAAAESMFDLIVSNMSASRTVEPTTTYQGSLKTLPRWIESV